MARPETGVGLRAAELQTALAGNLIGREILVLASTTSTNDAILERARGGAGEGLVLFAEEQTAGRGQRGNRWESAAGQGLWFSILLCPRLEAIETPRLTTWAAQGIAATISRRFSLSAIVKPPNDVYVGDKKIAGVLVEMRARPGAPHIAIAGIGINTSHTAADFSPALQSTATSLAALSPEPVDRQEFAIDLLRELDRTYRATFAP